MKFFRTCIAIIPAIIAVLFADPGLTKGGGFFSAYNLGVSYATTASYAAITYQSPKSKKLPDDCDTNDVSAGNMRCTAYLAPDGEGTYNISVLFEKPFKREGLFYFEPGLTLATVSYTGTLAPKPGGPLSSSKKTSSTSTSNSGPTMSQSGSTPPADSSSTAPLDHANIGMYGINWQTYIRFGITPRYLPDILASVGVGLQTVVGKVRVFTESTSTALVQPEAFGELEAVVARFKGGYLSGFVSLDQSLATPYGTNLIADNPSGTETSDYRLGLKASGSGIRLLFPF